jgi:hypothetical protein
MATHAVHDAPVEPHSGGAARVFRGRFAAWIASFPWAAWLTSGLFHGSLLLVLSLAVFGSPAEKLMWLTADPGDSPPLEDMNLEELVYDDIPVPGETGEASLGPVASGDGIELPGPMTGTVGNVRTGPTNAGSVSADLASSDREVAPVGVFGEFGGGDFATGLDVLTNPLASRGGGLEGRKFENRLAAALAQGGTRESEAAVERGLAWLAEHQFDDGSWRFDLESHPRCAGACGDSGNYQSTTASTGLALLSFLGAGYTQKEGKYAEVVSRGLYYLNGRLEPTVYGGDLRDHGFAMGAGLGPGFSRGAGRARTREDTMYSHGIATLALTEAYAMTRDDMLRQPATQAVKFIVSAQYDDGGWRYNPGFENNARGDMTVTGWQLAALKSAVLAGIDVPYDVWTRASAFIDTLAADRGASYTYLAGERGTAATAAIGLLCRMIGGWPQDSRPLQRGAALLGQQKPMQNNVYFIYYASQVLHHLGGARWEKWNPRMREYLIESQVLEGHETGSWYINESHSSAGGRLYTTTMAIMSLEVYYRYMPIYGESFVGGAP